MRLKNKSVYELKQMLSPSLSDEKLEKIQEAIYVERQKNKEFLEKLKQSELFSLALYQMKRKSKLLRTDLGYSIIYEWTDLMLGETLELMSRLAKHLNYIAFNLIEQKEIKENVKIKNNAENRRKIILEWAKNNNFYCGDIYGTTEI